MVHSQLDTNPKKPYNYIYDYPLNREISSFLLTDDIIRIAEKTGYSRKYIYSWCAGKRRNHVIMELAKTYAEINKRTISKKEKVEVNNI